MGSSGRGVGCNQLLKSNGGKRIKQRDVAVLQFKVSHKRGFGDGLILVVDSLFGKPYQ